MSKEDVAVSALAHGFMRLGFNPPEYLRPKWYQFRLKRKLRYYDKHNWPYTLKD